MAPALFTFAGVFAAIGLLAFVSHERRRHEFRIPDNGGVNFSLMIRGNVSMLFLVLAGACALIGLFLTTPV